MVVQDLEGELMKTANGCSDFALKLLEIEKERLKTAVPRDCPAEELILAYAWHELNAEDEKKIAVHVHECLDCLDMVIAARHAVAVDSAPIPLPAWLTADAEKSEVRTGKIIHWPYGSVGEMIEDIRQRWGEMIDWPLAAMKSLNFESALLAASFSQNALPMRAADDAGQIVTAKWIRFDDDNIAEVRPITVQIHNQKIVGNRLELVGELPPELNQIKVVLHFGWTTPDNDLISLKTETEENRSSFFSRSLIAKNDLDPEGKLKMLIA